MLAGVVLVAVLGVLAAAGGARPGSTTLRTPFARFWRITRKQCRADCRASVAPVMLEVASDRHAGEAVVRRK